MKQTDLLPNTKYRSDQNRVSLDIYHFDSKQRRDTALKKSRGRTPFSSYSKRKSYPLEVKNGMFTTPDFDAGKVIIYVSEEELQVGDKQKEVAKENVNLKPNKHNKKVLIASLVAPNQDKWLKRFLTAISNLEYPRNKLSYAFLVDDKKDRVFRMLNRFKRTHPRVRIIESKINFPLPRFSKLALLRNFLIASASDKEDYVLMIDSDIISIPSDLLQRLMENGGICAPFVFIEDYKQFKNGYFYDRLAYVYKGKRFNHFYPYLNGETELPATPFEVDSVGTCYLCDVSIFKNGVWFNSDRNMSEQVSFCSEARKRGYTVCINPNVSVLHCNFEKYNRKFK